MTVVTSREFINGSIAPSTRAFSWCPISKTKIALVYVATTDGVPKYFVQIVNFIDKQAVYMPPCVICPVVSNGNTQNPLPRMTLIGPNRLVFAVPETLGTTTPNGMFDWYSFMLLALADDDTVEAIHRTVPFQTSQAGQTLGSSMPLLTSGAPGSAFFSGTFVSSSGSGYKNVYTCMYLLQMVNDKLTITQGSTYIGIESPSNYQYFSCKRKDLDGNWWTVLGNGNGNMLYQNNVPAGQQLSVNQYGSGLLSAWKSILPIRKDVFGTINSTNFLVQKLSRNGVLPSSVINGISTLWTTPLQGFTAGGTIEDAIWLNDAGMFMFLALPDAQTYGYSYSPNTADTLARMSTGMSLIVGQYNETTGAVTMADKMPMQLNRSMARWTFDNLLHKVDESTIAIIGSFCPIGQTAVQHSILMVST